MIESFEMNEADKEIIDNIFEPRGEAKLAQEQIHTGKDFSKVLIVFKFHEFFSFVENSTKFQLGTVVGFNQYQRSLNSLPEVGFGFIEIIEVSNRPFVRNTKKYIYFNKDGKSLPI